MGSIVFIDFLNKLPPNNAVAVAGMLNQLYETSEDDIGFNVLITGLMKFNQKKG